MEINKQLFEDVLSGKLKGTFILTDDTTINSNSNKLIYTCGPYQEYRFEGIPYIFDCNGRNISPGGLSIIDFIIDEIDPEMYSYNEKDIQFIKHFINGPHMNENELTIEIPDNKVVDWDESKKQNKIVLKDKQVTYKDICKKLFENKEFFFTNAIGTIESSSSPVSTDLINAVNNSTSYHQLECILAKNKLVNVARYLNGEWKPIHGTSVWIIERNFHSEYYAEPIKVGSMAFDCYGLVIFKSSELAKQAIEILGEETIKLALEPLGI